MREWQGRVFTPEGRPAAGAVVRYGFESMRARGSQGEHVEVRTDQSGRFCFRWPSESVTASVSVDEAQSATGPADPRFETARPEDFAGETTGGPIPGAPILVSPDVTEERIAPLPLSEPGIDLPRYGSGRLSGSLWQPEVDAVDQCVASKVQPPWHRVSNLKENWRHRVLRYLSLGFTVMALGALAVPRRHRHVAGRAAWIVGGADLLLFVLVWVTKTI